jgi:hypothetical protein
MFLNGQWAVFRATTWFLFALWLLFGGVELAEQAHVISELAGQDQQDSDQDEDALAQLASGLRSDLSGLEVHHFAMAGAAVDQSVACSVCGSPRQQLLVHGPPSLRLHQSLSIYRI